MPHIPGSFDELEKAVEQGAQSLSHSAKKSVNQTLQSAAGQVKSTPSDFVKQLYGVKDEVPDEQNQQKTNKQHEVAVSPKELISPLPLRSEEEIKASSGPVLNPLGISQNEVKTISFGEQLTGQTSSNESLHTRIDPSKQMTEEEKRVLDEEQKEKREAMRQHDREYVMKNDVLDPIGTLEGQIAKVRQQKQQEEQQKEKEEEEEKEEKVRQEKEQQSRQLEAPRGKVRGAPNLAVDKGKKQAEIHRGTSG